MSGTRTWGPATVSGQWEDWLSEAILLAPRSQMGGVNFSLFSRKATGVKLMYFDRWINLSRTGGG